MCICIYTALFFLQKNTGNRGVLIWEQVNIIPKRDEMRRSSLKLSGKRDLLRYTDDDSSGMASGSNLISADGRVVSYYIPFFS